MSNVQCPMSNVPKTVQCPMSNVPKAVQCPMSNVQCPRNLSYLVPRMADLRRQDEFSYAKQTLDIGHWTAFGTSGHWTLEFDITPWLQPSFVPRGLPWQLTQKLSARQTKRSAREKARRRERLFFTGMSVAFVITVFAGFSRTYFLRPYFDARPLLPLLHLHGIVFSAWLALLLTQTTLVAANQTRIHRKLGIFGAILALTMVILGSVTAIIRAKVVEVPPGAPPPLVFLTIPLGDMLVFAILVGSAFYFRRRPDVHKRLILLSTIAILPAATARLPLDFIQQMGPLAFFGLADLFIVPCLIYDFITRGRPHRATVLGGALIVVSHPLRLVIGNTAAWMAFATWITQWS